MNPPSVRIRQRESLRTDWQEYPSYLSLFRSGELKHRVRALLALLKSCNVCPRNCRVKRLMDRRAICDSGRHAETNWYGVDRYENTYVSTVGTGLVIFAHNNLPGVFDQNHFTDTGAGVDRCLNTALDLAGIYLFLQEQGAQRLNWVSPSHVVPQAVEALALAVDRGLRLPLIYSSHAYDSTDTLKLLDGVVDIYMPEVMTVKSSAAPALPMALGYEFNAIAALREMWRQVGFIRLNADGGIARGLLVRHYFDETNLPATEECLRALKAVLGKDLSLAIGSRGRYRKGNGRRWIPIAESVSIENAGIRAILAKLDLHSGWLQESKDLSD